MGCTVGTLGTATHGDNSPNGSLDLLATTLSATAVSETEISLSWQDTNTNEAGYGVERSLTGGSDFTKIFEAPVDAGSLQDTELNPGTTYYYRVWAFGAANEIGPSSNVASATTLGLDTVAPTIAITSPTGLKEGQRP